MLHKFYKNQNTKMLVRTKRIFTQFSYSFFISLLQSANGNEKEFVAYLPQNSDNYRYAQPLFRVQYFFFK
jgi:hypothetical protein